MRRVARIRAPDKQALPFYLSSEWRGLMRRLIEERGRRCEKCRANGNDLGDHIVELKDGGALLDPANIQLLCGSHHTLKTNAMKRARLGLPAL